jgi:MSHA biogenesis protein MshP
MTPRFLPFSVGRPWHLVGRLAGRQRGVSIIGAVFLLLLMSLLAALMVNLTSTAHLNLAQDIGGARAYQAARAGVELGLYKVLQEDAANSAPALATSPLAGCFGALSPTIEGHAVAIACEPFGDYTEGSHTVRLYRITATATAFGPAGGIERQVVVSAAKCRDSESTVAPFDC